VVIAPRVLDAAAIDELAGDLDGERRVTLELRYAGQSFELAVPWEGDVRERFAAAHEERYGYRDPDGEIELVTVQVSAVRPGPRVELHAGAGAREPEGEREVTIDGRPHAAAIWRGELAEGARLAGPAVWHGPEATLLVAPGWSGAVDATGTVVLGRD
jgi:N-methylhydantoinase A